MELAQHGRPRAGHRHGEEHDEDDDADRDAVGAADTTDDGEAGDQQTDCHPDPADRAARHAFGDHPPSAGDRDSQADEGDQKVGRVAEEHIDHERDERHQANERRDRGESASGRDGDACTIHQ